MCGYRSVSDRRFIYFIWQPAFVHQTSQQPFRGPIIKVTKPDNAESYLKKAYFTGNNIKLVLTQSSKIAHAKACKK